LQTQPELIRSHTLFHWWPGGCWGNGSGGFHINTLSPGGKTPFCPPWEWSWAGSGGA